MGISRLFQFTDRSKKRAGSFGFTLIELIVVMGIITVLSTILIGYSRQSSKNLLLTSTEAKLLSLISRAKFLAIETFFQQVGVPQGEERVCAYGVRVDTDAGEIFIFEDKSGTGNCAGADNVYASSTNDIRLQGELDVVKLDTRVLTLTSDFENIVFIPPDPDVGINGNLTTREASLEIGIVNDVTNFVITVNDAGQVSAK